VLNYRAWAGPPPQTSPYKLGSLLLANPVIAAVARSAMASNSLTHRSSIFLGGIVVKVASPTHGKARPAPPSCQSLSDLNASVWQNVGVCQFITEKLLALRA